MSLVFSGREQNELWTSVAELRAIWSFEDRIFSIGEFFIRREGYNYPLGFAEVTRGWRSHIGKDPRSWTLDFGSSSRTNSPYSSTPLMLKRGSDCILPEEPMVLSRDQLGLLLSWDIG